MNMPLYDTRPYTVPIPREPGWYTVTCRVTWTPRGGAVTLSCGLGEALVDLELTDWRWPDDHVRALCDDVDRQLLLAPTATLRCPMGTAVIELVPPTSKV